MNGVNILGRQILPPVPREVPPVQELSIVHGMAELQSLDKPTLITTCFQLAEHFVNQLFQTCSDSDEIHLRFRQI